MPAVDQDHDDSTNIAQDSDSAGALVVAYLLGLITIPLIYLVMSLYYLLPERTGTLVGAHQDLAALHQELQSMAADMPTGVQRDQFVKSYKARLKRIMQSVASSKHPAKSSLTTAKANLDSAATKSTEAEVLEKLDIAGKKLQDAAVKLGLLPRKR